MRTHISQRVCVERRPVGNQRRNFDRVRVNRVVGRLGNRTVTVVVDMGDGYERRMRQAILLVYLRLEAIPKTLSLSEHRRRRARQVVIAASRRNDELGAMVRMNLHIGGW